MFIRLTRADGLPIWLNASFIVTVEPTRSGGSIVVPIGDGLDYDVKEAPETVLALLNEAPPAKVVPVPPPKALTPMPEDVSPDIGIRRGDDGDEAGQEPEGQTDSGESKPAPKKRGRRRTKAAAKKPEETKADHADTDTQPPPAVEPVQNSRSVPQDFDKIVEDLKARKCRTAKRMRNAIKSFFGKTDEAEIDYIIETMINRGYVLIGADGHIDWTA